MQITNLQRHQINITFSEFIKEKLDLRENFQKFKYKDLLLIILHIRTSLH